MESRVQRGSCPHVSEQLNIQPFIMTLELDSKPRCELTFTGLFRSHPGPERDKTALGPAGQPRPASLLSFLISNAAAVATTAGCKRTSYSEHCMSVGPTSWSPADCVLTHRKHVSSALKKASATNLMSAKSSRPVGLFHAHPGMHPWPATEGQRSD